MSDKLPATLTGLIILAINEARKLDRTLYYPHFGHWYYGTNMSDPRKEPIEPMSLCKVCFAGSVIAGIYKPDLGVGIWSPRLAEEYAGMDADDWCMMAIIDWARLGHYKDAFAGFYDEDLDLDLDSDVEEMLGNIPKPNDLSSFQGWPEYDAFLVFLETRVLSPLEEVEAIYRTRKGLTKEVFDGPF